MDTSQKSSTLLSATAHVRSANVKTHNHKIQRRRFSCAFLLFYIGSYSCFSLLNFAKSIPLIPIICVRKKGNLYIRFLYRERKRNLRSLLILATKRFICILLKLRDVGKEFWKVWGRGIGSQKRLTVTHVSISLNYLIMKGGNFFTKSIAKIMNNYQNCNDLHQKYS